MAREGKVYVFDHPLIQHKVSLMRKNIHDRKGIPGAGNRGGDADGF